MQNGRSPGSNRSDALACARNDAIGTRASRRWSLNVATVIKRGHLLGDKPFFISRFLAVDRPRITRVSRADKCSADRIRYNDGRRRTRAPSLTLHNARLSSSVITSIGTYAPAFHNTDSRWDCTSVFTLWTALQWNSCAAVVL